MQAENTKVFSDWLSQFAAIDSSLVIEVDIFNEKFIAKSTTADVTFACYSELSFSDAHFKFGSANNLEIQNNQRVKLGILLSLDKFINILSPFNKSLVDITIEIQPNSEKLDNPSNIIYMSASRLTLKNTELQMTSSFAEEHHFTFVSDSAFFNILYKLSDPITVDIPTASMKESVSVSNIYNKNVKKDRVDFTFDCSIGDTVVEKISTSDAAGNYKMDIVDLTENPIQLKTNGDVPIKPTTFKVLKRYVDIFLSATQATSSKWSFPYNVNEPRQNRILIESDNSYFCLGGLSVEDVETI